MSSKGIQRLLSAAYQFDHNRKHLESDDQFFRYYARRKRDEYLNAASEVALAEKQHRTLLSGIGVVLNNIRDVEGGHYRTLDDIAWALESVLRRYRELEEDNPS